MNGRSTSVLLSQVNIPSDLHLVSFIGSLSDDHHVNYKELSHSIGFVCYM